MHVISLCCLCHSRRIPPENIYDKSASKHFKYEPDTDKILNHACLYISMYLYIPISVSISIYVCACVRIQLQAIYISTYIHTYTHIHIHIQMHI